MDVNNSSFLFLSTGRYFIPFFQRKYVWNKDNWNKLIENIIDDGGSHFLGSIILKKDLKGKYSVIDGQQRITTICVLLKACLDIINSKEKDETYQQRINYCLFHAEAPGVQPRIDEDNLSLEVNHSIETEFKNIIMGRIPYENIEYKNDRNVSNIINCYKYFCGKITNEEDVLIDVISYSNAKKIVDLLLKPDTEKEKDGCIVKIELETKDNEQRIFDTINAEGVKLTCVDIIKNNLYQRYKELLKKELKDEEEAYKNYSKHWEPIFENKNSKYWEKQIQKLFGYIGTILKIYDRNKNNEDELHFVFKEYIDAINSVSKIEKLIELILNIAIIYKQYLYPEKDIIGYIWNDTISINNLIINKTGENTLLPYVINTYLKHAKLINLELIDDLSEISFNETEKLYKDLHIINSTAIRFYLCKNAGRKIKNFNKKIIDVIDVDISKFAHELANDSNNNKADISNTNFKAGLLSLDKNEKGKLILFLLELYRRSKDSKSDKTPLQYNYSLEHIIAQDYEKYWNIKDHPAYSFNNGKGVKIEADLMANQVREQAIYSIGNMLLLTGSQNSSQSNKYITYKVESKYDIKDGKDNERWSSYETCNDLSITHDVTKMYKRNLKDRKENELWDERDVIERSLLLINEITQIFEIK